jgi:hypothetical protein
MKFLPIAYDTRLIIRRGGAAPPMSRSDFAGGPAPSSTEERKP